MVRFLLTNCILLPYTKCAMILPEPIAFEWDKGNIDKNLKKHKISNKEAEEIFENDPKFIFKDEKHSQLESRYGIFGQTNRARKLSVVFVIRKNRIRIITARRMSRKERSTYEEKIKSYSKI